MAHHWHITDIINFGLLFAARRVTIEADLFVERRVMQKPTYGEWRRELDKIFEEFGKESGGIVREDDAMLYAVVSSILWSYLDAPPDHSSDYNRVVDELVDGITVGLRGHKLYGVIAYIRVMIRSSDRITRSVGEQIQKRLIPAQ